ncbi:MAG: hypothetical protein ACM3VS_16320 [Candidatus Dadabacteria bacterium]
MSTLIVAAIVLGTVAGVIFLIVSIHNKHNREAMNSLLKHFSLLGSENELVFSSQQILKNCILGLDGSRRKLLVVKREGNLFGSFIINLEEVKNCTVKKIYGNINADGLLNKKLDQYLEKVVLHFDLMEKPSVEVVFYNHIGNSIFEAPELEQKARGWESILSKMLTPLKKIA